MSTKKNSLLFKIKTKNEEVHNSIDFYLIDFLNKGPFKNLLDQIFGIATHNFFSKHLQCDFKEGVN